MMILRTSRPASLLACLVLATVSTVRADEPPSTPALSATPAREWTARFAGREGWIGGDAVYSVKVNDRRIVWFFGDTFVGTVKNGRRDGAAMVNNSVGILDGTGAEADAKLTFHFGKTPDGKPAAFLTPKGEAGFYWPLGGAMSGTRLVQTVTRVETTKGGGPFGFKTVAQLLAIIENPGEDPAKWTVKHTPLPHAIFEATHERFWGCAYGTVNGTTYIYGCEERSKKLGARQLLVARVPNEKLADVSAWQFRTKDGWSPRSEDAASLAGGLATEFSVVPAPGGGFVAVYTENGIGDRIVGRYAPEPFGPWSEPRLIYSCPEKANSKVFTYAAKAHGWHDVKEGLLISYCTNGWKFATSIESDAVYRPQFVKVKIQP